MYMSQLTFPAALNEQLSEADGQFREGHFESADELYTKLLADIENLEDFENADIGSLVLKIAESRYAAGAYEKAKLAYEQLLTLQEKKHDTSSKDRIFTCVKAARNYEKCDEQTNAQSRYEQAYELAKTVLPVKHFLRRTVFECYAQWLRTQKSNPLVLSILESELGTRPAPLAEEPDTEPVEQEKKSSEKREPRKGADDFANLKSKLGRKRQPDKQPDKRPVDSDSSNLGTEQKASKLPQSIIDKSMDRQVAARKFLNISLGPQKEKVNKSRLKSALIEDFVGSTESSERSDATPIPENVQHEAILANAVETADAANVADVAGGQVGQDLLAEAEELLKNLEIAEQNKSVSLLVSPESTIDSSTRATLRGAPSTGLEESSADSAEFDLYQTYGTSSTVAIDLEMERLLAESARLLFNIESLSGPGESQSDPEQSDDGEKRTNSGLLLRGSSGVAMRHSERSYFGQEEEKKPKGAKFSLADIIEKYVPSTGALRTVILVAVPLVLIVSGVCFAVLSNSNSKPEQLADAPKYMKPFLGQNFGTADGAISLNFKPNQLEIQGRKLKRQPKVFFWQGTTNDELRLLQGTLKNCVWLAPSKEGLKTSDGQIFYSANAPEIKVREIMNTIKTNALGYFSASGTYPNPEAVQPDRYLNPVSGRYDPVNACTMIVGKERPQDAETRLDLDLENGQMFNNEPAAKPGAVGVFCVQLGDPNHLPGMPSASGLSEPVTTQSMYIHGFDRNGELLRTGAEQKILLIELKPHGLKNLSSGDDAAKYQTSDICFTQGEPPSQPAIALKYGLIGLLILSIVGFFIWLQQVTPKNQ
ncbi:hypothetical protein BH10CYA1_BH10CYA1_37490 [soil metagenome]